LARFRAAAVAEPLRCSGQRAADHPDLGGSILTCAAWHGLYNLETGTDAATATIQAVTAAFVYVLAFLLVGFKLRAGHLAKRPFSAHAPTQCNPPLSQLLGSHGGDANLSSSPSQMTVLRFACVSSLTSSTGRIDHA
jgi:hypothetical protein